MLNDLAPFAGKPTPTGSMAAASFVLDVLATGMTLRRGVDFQPHLRKIKESLNASRYPIEDDELN